MTKSKASINNFASLISGGNTIRTGTELLQISAGQPTALGENHHLLDVVIALFRLRRVALFALCCIPLFFFLNCSPLSSNNDDVPYGGSVDGLNVSITMNADELNLSPGDTLILWGSVSTDDYRAIREVSCSWRSNIDGVLRYVSLDSLARIQLVTNKLSQGIHIITLEVSNSFGESVADTVTVNILMGFTELTAPNDVANLSWNKYEGLGFSEYVITRYGSSSYSGSATEVYRSSSITSTTCNDTGLILGANYYYKVTVNRIGRTQVHSSMTALSAGTFIQLELPLLKVVVDQKRGVLYGIATPGIFDNTQDGIYGLIRVDLSTRAMTGHILTRSRFDDLDIDPSGDLLILCGRQQKYLTIVDLNTFALNSEIPTEKTGHKVEAGMDGMTYYHATPPTSGWTEFRVVDTKAGKEVPLRSYFDGRHGDIELANAQRMLYHVEGNTTSASLYRLDVSEKDRLVPMDTCGVSYNSGSTLVLSSDGSTLYQGNTIYSADLNVVARFPEGERIAAVSPLGELAASTLYIYRTSDQSIVSKVPAEFTSMAFSSLERELILVYSSQPLYQQFESRIYFFEF